jgi:hypothetical protein
MLWLLNYLNRKWNRAISLFHDLSVKTNIRWLVVLSVWAYDRLIWNLPDKYQLVGDMRLSEYKLLRELELAHHQIGYYADYANELQWQLLGLSQQEESEEVEKLEETLTV